MAEVITDKKLQISEMKYQCKCTCQGLRAAAVDAVLKWLFCSVDLPLVEITVVLSFGHCKPFILF